uniref:Uncharacterized protein n=1 Tax=Arundo donax TaxID=35708 RepID=A0A0A9H448_ARUDO
MLELRRINRYSTLRFSPRRAQLCIISHCSCFLFNVAVGSITDPSVI